MNDTPKSPKPNARRATVMFADISGFTALGERLDPEEVIGIVNGAFHRLEEIVYAQGGAIDEYLGDCVKAAFGLTLTAGNGASHAVHAAMAMRDAVAQYNVDRGLEPPLGIHIGLDTGVVATVPTGATGDNKTCVMGEAARLASRLEDASERGQIFVGPDTYAATQDEFEYSRVSGEDADKIPVPIYELLGEIPLSERKRASERRRATIVFADLIGADDIAPDAPSLEVAMGDLFEDMTDAVVEYEGVVNQYTGDGVMALFGIPNAIEDAPKQALNSALRIRERVERYAEEHQVELSVHIGVNTGNVIAGRIGGSVRKSFTGVGDPVNMSARIKEASPAGAIYVGPETHRLTHEQFEFEALEPMNFKGKSKPVPVFRLASETRQIHRRDADHGRRIFSTVVGRDKELATLAKTFDRLNEGTGGAISLLGEAGLGKTRLLTEALARLDGDRTTILHGRSLSIGANLAFHPFIDLLRGWASIDEKDGEDVAIPKLQRAMQVMGADADEALPFIATLLGLRPPGAEADRIAAMDGDAIEKLVTKSLRDLLTSMAASQPTILVLEDVHWADRSSVILIESLLGLAGRAPLLFCFVTRPDYADSGDYVMATAKRELAEKHVQIILHPLRPEDIQELIDNLLDIDDLPGSVRAMITEKAGGNPFFIEEVVRELVDAGAIMHDAGRFRVTDKIADVVIPNSVQEVIMVRIDRLAESKRHILQLASVIGRSFSFEIIAETIDQVMTLADDLEELKNKQILVEKDARWEIPVGERTVVEELEYVFKHALAQETIYSSILHQTRKDLHGKVAVAIEDRFAERLKEFFDTLSYHYLRAENLPKAEDYSFRAGEESARAGASREALEHFRQAERLDQELRGENGDPEHRERLKKNLGLALMNIGQLPESLPHFDQALVHLGERVPVSFLAVQGKFAIDLVSVVVDAMGGHALRRRRPGTERDDEFFEILNARARASVTSDPRRIFYDNIGGVRRMNGIDSSSFPPSCAMYAVAGGMFSFSGLSLGLARRFLSRAKHCRTEGDPNDEFDCHSLEFTINYLGGDWADEHLLAPRLVNESIRSGLFWDVQNYLGLACDRLQRQGRFEEAQKNYDRLAELRDAYDFEFAGTNFNGESAMFHLERRDLDQARDFAERYLDGRDEYALRVLALGTYAKILTHAEDFAAATKALEEAEQILADADVVPPWHTSAYSLARLNFDVEQATRSEGAERRGHLARARKASRKALSTTASVASQRTEALRLAGTTEWLRGKKGPARRYWEQSLTFGEGIQARPEVARTRATIARLEAPDAPLAGSTATEHGAQARDAFEDMGLAFDLRGLS